MSSNQESSPKQSSSVLVRWLRRLFILAVVLSLAAVGAVLYITWPRTERFFTDNDSIIKPADSEEVRDILWQPPKELPAPINSLDDDYEPKLTEDGGILYFVRGKAGHNSDIYYCTRTHEGWTEPVALTELNTEHDELGPEPTADGRSLYFYSDRPGGCGGYDLWVAHRGLDGRSGLGEPINLGPVVNSEFNDYGPAVTRDGKSLYFSSNRPQPQDAQQPDPEAWPGTIREDLHQRTYDLYLTTVTEHGYGQAAPLSSLNTRFNEGAPCASPFGDFIYFASDRPGGEGEFDLYRSRVKQGQHESAENLGDTLNTASNELDPGLTMGGYALYFSSDRPLEEASQVESKAYRVYQSTSREVFLSSKTTRATIDWGALWQEILPNLLYALLALLLLLLFLIPLGDIRKRQLGLLARCLLASLAAHMLILMLCNLWQVTTVLAGRLSRGGPIQIALAAPTNGDAIASQIRGDLTDVQPPAHQDLAVEQKPLSVEVETPTELVSLAASTTPIANVSALTIEHTAQEAVLSSPLHQPVTFDKPVADPTTRQVELAIPREQDRVEVQEQILAANPPAVEQDAESRPTLSQEHFEDTSTAELATLRPEENGAIREHTVESLSTDTPRTADARPVVSASLVADQAVAPVLDDIHTLDVALPEGPQRTTTSEEQNSNIEIRRVDPVRGPLSAESVEIATDERLIELVPVDVPDLPESGTLAFEIPVEAGEAQPVADTAPLPSSFEASSLLTPPADLALPGMEESSESRDETQVEPLSPDTDLPSLRSDLQEVEHVQADHEIRKVDVDSSIEELPRESLASKEHVEVVDASSAVSSVESPDSSSLDLPNLPLADLALPDMDESSQRTDEIESEEHTAIDGQSVRRPLHADRLVDAVDDSRDFHLPPAKRLDEVVPQESLVEDDAEPVAVDVDDLPIDGIAPVLPDVTADLAFDLELDLPSETTWPDDPYAQRARHNRLDVAKGMGGGEETEAAVALALAWLARHQSADGRWDSNGFDENCGQCGGEAESDADVALTGLAVLCFLAADHTHDEQGPYQDNVRRALRWLVEQQKDDGDLRGEETMYSHGIATIALAEAYGMTRDPRLFDPVNTAVSFICEACNRRHGGWRYDPGQPGDTSVTGWQVMALKSAKEAGFDVPMEPFINAREWLDKVSRPKTPGLYAYQPGRSPTPSMTAEGLFVQHLLGVARTEPRMRQSVDFLLGNLPSWEHEPNTYYWYYGTLAMFHNQGEPWRIWNEVLIEQLLPNQRKDGQAAGSWDPNGEWASIGGRVYQTTLCTLMLEVYYRYLPLFLKEESVEGIGRIRGVVYDAKTGEVLERAVVKLDLPDRDPIEVMTNDGGEYELHPPELPTFFALSAAMNGYVPQSKNVARAMVSGTTLNLDFELAPHELGIIATEAVPEVHHLGDDDFDGRINSQFQRDSEGAIFNTSFVLVGAQLPPNYKRAMVTMLAKGVQMRHPIRINGYIIDQRLDDAPSDGSFGEFAAEFDPYILRAGENTLEILAQSRGSDIDDFEFVNVQIVLSP